jgi:hypothetical protein
MVAILLAQAAVAPIDFDLAKMPTTAATCGRGNASEIVVCEAPDRRLHTPDKVYADKPVRADFGLGNGARLKVEAVTRALPGASAPAPMVTLSIPLGAGKK